MFFEKKGDPIKLSVSVEPRKTGIFLDYYSPPKIKNTAHFFGELTGLRVDALQLADRDRYLKLTFHSGEQLIFQLYGNNANVFAVRGGYILSSFKHQKVLAGKEAPQARKPDAKRYKELKGNARQRLVSLNHLFPRPLLGDLIDYFQLEGKTDEEMVKFADRLDHEFLNRAVPAMLPDGRVCILADDFLPLPGKKRFDSFNECIRSSYYYNTYIRKFEGRKTTLMNRLLKHQKKLQKRQEGLSGADKSMERARQYEKFGHLLMANLYRPVTAETDHLKVDDLYDEGKTIAIPLKKMSSLSDNAALYYEKSREAKTAFEKAGERLEAARAGLGTISEMISELESVDSLKSLDAWIKARQKDILEAGAGQPEGEQARHPFRKITESGFDFWIGKNAKSNDELLRESHKEDIWLHARGYAGSHVIIRMNRRTGFPEMPVLEKAASFAARYSKGAGSSLIPVIYAKRKHVRKPKGAAPGLVKVSKEQVILSGP
ncbi:MAG: NFACT RNA binding domain-containing protein [Balneolales bacterium]